MEKRRIRDIGLGQTADMIHDAGIDGVNLSFRTHNADGKEVPVAPISATALIEDWYGDCNICPANDAPVYDLCILFPDNLELNVVGNITFEELMSALGAEA